MFKLVFTESCCRLQPNNEGFIAELGGNPGNNDRHIEQLHWPLPQDRGPLNSR